MTDLLTRVEDAVKIPLWDCRTCGQCVLHSTGMTCPMTCPKTLRNGPCGGVREDGGCEVKPEMRCVWVKAEARSRTLPLLPRKWRDEINHLRPPVDNQLERTSSWRNLLTGRDRVTPVGWQGEATRADPVDWPRPSMGEFEGPFTTPFHPREA
ncbi:MAG: methylenetetrahydrofolate reductase C-terminal domain-containing protein [Actinomycetota bacterium]|nr:methylenetetrahydrofolate reductase C-terminal domain-containing protein [Actinomycetota bacterium]MDH4353444.1 methylenetetrahydrofolate reductase C-terminal domain-containing protein [Actinomycetota bacterium]MDH5279374.1 methylenetetrahydrofolate reductase C-terminal domain-containing protein [Actinomycetota bacterium]